MGDSPHFFAIVHSPGRRGGPVVLHAALLADATSVAFARELARLQRLGATGELRVTCLATHRVVLRQPLASTNEVGDQGWVAQDLIPSMGEPLFGV